MSGREVPTKCANTFSIYQKYIHAIGERKNRGGRPKTQTKPSEKEVNATQKAYRYIAQINQVVEYLGTDQSFGYARTIALLVSATLVTILNKCVSVPPHFEHRARDFTTAKVASRPSLSNKSLTATNGACPQGHSKEMCASVMLAKSVMKRSYRETPAGSKRAYLAFDIIPSALIASILSAVLREMFSPSLETRISASGDILMIEPSPSR